MPSAYHRSVRLLVVIGVVVSLVWPAYAAQKPTARSLYQSAVALESQARKALEGPGAQSRATLTLMRRAISAFRAVVRAYPRSGYCDDALWQAAGLARDAFTRFGEERDRTLARTLLNLLIEEYPTSRLVPLARGVRDRLSTLAYAGGAPAAPKEPPAAPPAAPTPRPPARMTPVQPVIVRPEPPPPQPLLPSRPLPGQPRPPRPEMRDTPRPPAPEPPPEAAAGEPLWSLPIEPAGVVGLLAPPPPVRATAPIALPMTRSITPITTAYAGFVPRTQTMPQPLVQVSMAAQVTTGDEIRTGGQPTVDPDLGLQLFQPGLAVGNLYADVNVTHRDDRVALGRAVVRLDNVRFGGLTWTLDGGDTWNEPVIQHFGFSNLFAPAVTFEGVSASGSSPRTFLVVSGGRVTAQRNIFGTDTEPIGQRIYQGLFSHRASDRLDVFAHANHIDSRDMTLYTPLTDWSTDGGGGLRFRPLETVELVADGGVSQFRRHGAPDAEVTPSGLIGALWSFARGWAQVNAQRYPIGRFPVYNYPYIDRAGVFASGEIDVGAYARLFGGAEYAIANLDPEASADATAGIAPGNGARGYGGVRVSLFGHSMVTARVDGGSRRTEPSRFGPGYDNNTGVAALDWNSRFSTGNVFARYERRRYVDPNSDASSFIQHDLLTQAYLSFPGGRQVFGKFMYSRRADRSDDGQTMWQAGGGWQAPIGRLYGRLEFTAGRTINWLSELETPRQSLSAGVTGTIAKGTYLSLDWYLDHMPAVAGSTNPWVTRTMVRVTRAFPFGSSRSAAPGGLNMPRGGPTGRVAGEVFVDWNGNGEPDEGEEPVSGIGILIPGVATVETGKDGRFLASGVPTGEQPISLQTGSLPADFDPPVDGERTVSVSRNQVASVAFGVLPLGSFGGVVYQDVDGDGQLGPADAPIDGAVLVMDDGSRTEITRGGRFSFDPVRMGKHTVTLLVASLPEGSQIAGADSAEVTLSRGEHPQALAFLVKLEKRPEIRKVFPVKK